MQRLSKLIQRVADIEGLPVDFMMKRSTVSAVFCKNIISWTARCIYGYRPNIIASALGYSVGRNNISRACRVIENEICILHPHTLHILTELLCKEEKTAKEKTGGICSPSILYRMLLKYLPSELQNTLRTRGKISQTGTTDIKQPSSVTSSNAKADRYTMKKASSHTSPTQRGTRSFLFTSDTFWANRESLRYDFATREEQYRIYTALLVACEWGRKCDYENQKRMSELKNDSGTVYISMID